MSTASGTSGGWYGSTVRTLLDDLEVELGALTPANAWQFIFLLVTWQELHKVNEAPERFLHVNDKMSTVGGQTQARMAEAWLRNTIPANELADPDFLTNFGRFYGAWEADRGKALRPESRNNVTGTAFEVVIQEMIQRLCGIRPLRQQPLDVLQGFELAPRRYHSRPDLGALHAGRQDPHLDQVDYEEGAPWHVPP